MKAPLFRTEFDPAHGRPVTVAPAVSLITARNGGPFTFHGTNSYILGERTVAVIDPGPDDDSHLRDLLSAIGKREVSHILVTHTHGDHSPLARRLARETGAPMLAQGRHRSARDLLSGERNPLEASADMAFEPDIVLAEGDIVEGDGWRLEAVYTPGHTANHMAYALSGSDLLFSGDHVMAWATTVVAPPDGAMADYLASLDRLLARTETTYLPGHGGRLENAREFVRALKAHRKMRERAILTRIEAGDRSVGDIVAHIYRDTDPRLHAAAGLTVLAHLEDLVARGLVLCSGPVALGAEYLPAR
jgi:glyoxylase-like metal-dependent hydrolase (beta-lactamase superfamily II)